VAEPVPQQHSLRRLFQTVTERSFLERLGWPDWVVVDYLSNLLVECVHAEHLYPAHGVTGQRLVELVDMLQEAERRGRYESPERERDLHRQIGDYALLMTGLFAHDARRRHSAVRVCSEGGVDAVMIGKRAYRLVADRSQESVRDQRIRQAVTALFRQLSVQFERCVEGLGYVRQELVRLQASDDPRLRRLLTS